MCLQILILWYNIIGTCKFKITKPNYELANIIYYTNPHIQINITFCKC